LDRAIEALGGKATAVIITGATATGTAGSTQNCSILSAVCLAPVMRFVSDPASETDA